jgi:hypothetical protein
MKKMDRVASWIDLGEVPAALRLLAVMEAYGQIDPAEAAEWRWRIGGWKLYRELRSDTPPNA